MTSESRLPAFVVCAPGLEALVGAELTKLGIGDAKPRHGGVGCTLTWPQLGLVHLHSRIATRVLVRIARFDAPTFRDLERGTRAVDWAAWWPEGATPDLRVASSGSVLYHTGAIEERVLPLLPWSPTEPHLDADLDDDLDDGSPPASRSAPLQAVHLRVQHDAVTISLDASGAALHKRGWRTHVHDAPLRETLAAALLMVSEWDRKRPLVDPCCGSGTIPIEAALMARRIPPGRHRDFAFQAWPKASAVRWDRLVASADADVLDRALTIIGGDRGAEPLDAARANAAQAGVADTIRFEHVSAGALELPDRPGAIVTNPPYGERLRASDPALRDLATLLRRAERWSATVLAPEGLIARLATLAIRTAPSEPVTTTNGGLRVVLGRL